MTPFTKTSCNVKSDGKTMCEASTSAGDASLPQTGETDPTTGAGYGPHNNQASSSVVEEFCEMKGAS